MGVRADSKVVIPGVEDIGLRLIGVIACQIVLADRDRKVFRRARGDLLFVEAAELHRGLFHPVQAVILGIRRLEVDLHRVLAVNSGVVFHVDTYRQALARILDGKIRVDKIGVAEAVTEGKGDLRAVVKLTRVALTEHIVLVARLKIPVADIDPLLIDDVIQVAFVDTGRCVVLRGSKPVGLRVCVREGVVVCHGGRSMVVLEKGIHNPAGGIDLARQDISHRGDAIHAQISDPEHGVKVVIVDEIQLQRAGGVEQHHDLLEDALFLERLQVFEKLPLLPAELQIVSVRHVRRKALQPGGQIRALAGGTGEDDDGAVAEVGEAALERVGILLPGYLVDAVLIGASAGEVGVDPLIARGLIELPQLGVDAAGSEAVLQRTV